MNESLPIYAIADTVGIRLGRDVHGRLRGHKNMDLLLGPWTLNTDVLVEHDFQNAQAAAVWLKLRKHLWAYVLCKDKQLYLVLFDASVVKLVTADIHLFATGKLTESLAKIEVGAVASFLFVDQWTACDFPAHLLTGRFTKNPDGAGKRLTKRPRTPA